MNEKKLKLVIISILCVFSVFVYYKGNDKKTIEKEVVEIANKDYRQVFYLDKDGTLIPISIAIEKETSIEAQVKTMIEKMSSEAEANKTGMHAILPTNLKVLSFVVQDGKGYVNFSSELATYPKEKELKVLEAIVWTVTQYKEVKEVEIQMEGEKLTHMPVDNLPITKSLSRNLGINNFEHNKLPLHETKGVTFYYVKEVSGQTLYVPKTVRVSSDLASVKEVMDVILDNISVSSSLEQNENYKGLMVLGNTDLIDGKLVINLNEKALSGDLQISKELYDSLVLSIQCIEGVETVSIMVEDQIVNVSGFSEEEIQVSNVVYNVVAS